MTTTEPDCHLIDLVDALVEAIGRLRAVLERFGATTLFDAELRLNGTPSQTEARICGEGF